MADVGMIVPGLPGVRSTVTANPYTVFRQRSEYFIALSRIIDGTKSRDVGNTNDIDRLRPGLLMGKVTSGGKYANAIIGTTTNAETGASTSIETSAASATELVRRVGTTGTFKLSGPPVASGTVRTLTATYSAVDTSTGAITVTALGVSDVWTLTAPAGQDGGMYQLEVTTGKGTSAESIQTTAALAANANTATVDAALEALTNVGASGVAAVYSDPTLTLTFASNLGPVHVRVLADTTNDGGVFEGGWAAVHTTTGVDGRFIAGSWIQPTDGSGTVMTFLPDGYPTPVTYEGSSQDQPFPKMPISGVVDTSKIIDWPTDTSMIAWLEAQLKADSTGNFVFSAGF